MDQLKGKVERTNFRGWLLGKTYGDGYKDKLFLYMELIIATLDNNYNETENENKSDSRHKTRT